MHIIRKTAHFLIKMLSKRQSLFGSNEYGSNACCHSQVCYNNVHVMLISAI